MGWKEYWNSVHKREIDEHTECAIVDIEVDNEDTLKLAICRYIDGVADDFETIAGNAVYGLYGSGHDYKVVKVEKLLHTDFENRIEMKREKYGDRALKTNYSMKILSSGKLDKEPSNEIKDSSDLQQAEDEADFNNELDDFFEIIYQGSKGSEPTAKKFYICESNGYGFVGVIETVEPEMVEILTPKMEELGYKVSEERPKCCLYARGIPTRLMLGEDSYVEYGVDKYHPSPLEAIKEVASKTGKKLSQTEKRSLRG